MAHWIYGIDKDGDEHMLGPFWMAEQGEMECEMKGVHQLRFVQADSRQGAMAKIRGQKRKRSNLLVSDEPMQPMGSFVNNSDDEDDDDL